MPFKPFQTHVGSLIYVREDAGQFTVCIVAEREKELLTTPVEEAAVKCAEGWQAHYEKRAVEEADANVNAG